jgi:hypothetical protein
MSIDLIQPAQKRKVLSLKTEKEAAREPCFVEKDKAVYMVWRVGGDMPKRVYLSHEVDRARSHAKMLSKETGYDFHVLRSYRAYTCRDAISIGEISAAIVSKIGKKNGFDL